MTARLARGIGFGMLVVFGLIQGTLLAQPPSLRLLQPESLPAVDEEAESLGPGEPLSPLPDQRLQLPEAEALALAFHPALAEAFARVRAARYRNLQVGLPPNPKLGYLATEVGNDGRAGQQGIWVSQEFVRGNKLQLNRAVQSQEVRRLEQEYSITQRRVLTEVRSTYYKTYLAQRETELLVQLVEISRQAADSARALREALERPLADQLQAEIEAERAQLDLVQAQNKLQGQWRRLAALVGLPATLRRPLVADLESLDWPLSWEETIARVISQSPQVAEATAQIEKSRRAIARASAEPIPNLEAQLIVQYDDATSDTIAGVAATVPLPLLNRNQGGIGQAQAELTAASRRLEAIQLQLRQQVATSYQRYSTAEVRAFGYRENILRRAQRNLELVRQGYEAGEVGFLELLVVQRTFFQASLEYLQILEELSVSIQKLARLLVTDP